ncbi:hypothetical protein FDK38_001401 [Candidozyma auris]|nr:hypothetical protein FDK38_001401 [[Candida] auris]
MLCSLSGEEAQEPVVSPRSGCIFEKRLIASYISTTGKDPITEDALAVEELVEVKNKEPVIVPPKPPAFNSIPTMLAAFQNEWDALALESFTLRKQLHDTKQQLSAALYQYDAAVRVAARALKERDEARNALVELSKSFGQGSMDVDTEVKEVENGKSDSVAGENGEQKKENSNESGKLPPSVAQEIESAQQHLFKLHKSQKLTVPFSEKVSFKSEIEPHKMKNPKNSIALSSTGEIAIFDEAKVLQLPSKSTVKTSNATGVAYSVDGEKIVVAQKTKIQFYSVDGKNDGSFRHSHKYISNVIAHPTAHIIICVTEDRWIIIDGEKEVFDSGDVGFKIAASALHVDGRLLALASDEGEVVIVDTISNDKVASIRTKYTSFVKLQFALNGYWLLAGTYNEDKGATQVFDLRKNSLLHEIEHEGKALFSLDKASSVLATYVVATNELSFSFYIKKEKKWVEGLCKSNPDKPILQLVNVFHEDAGQDYLPKFVALTKEHVQYLTLDRED